MLELTLTRDPADKRHYVLPGVGEAHVTGLLKPLVTASTPRGTWTFGGKLGLRSHVEAVDATGTIVAVADLGSRQLRYGDRELRLEGGLKGKWKGRSDVEVYDGDRLLVRYQGVQWMSGSQRVTVDPQVAEEHGLLVLFMSHGAGYFTGLDGASAGLMAKG